MRGGVVRSLACSALWACLLVQAAGCAFQRVSERATTGAIEAFALPGEEEEFRRNVQRLAQRTVKEALEVVPPPSAEEIARNTLQGFLDAANSRLGDPRNREWMREMVREAVAEALVATRRELLGQA